jgi:hypothetical protein
VRYARSFVNFYSGFAGSELCGYYSAVKGNLKRPLMQGAASELEPTLRFPIRMTAL